MVIYLNGTYLEKDQARLSLDDRGFLFADGVYEVIRIYNGVLFEAPAHLARLADGLRKMQIGFVGAGEISAIADHLLEENDVAPNGFRLYVQITRGAAPRQHAFPPSGTPPTIYCEVGPLATHPEDQERGAAAITTADQRWARCDIKSTALLPNVLANQLAVEAGAREAIFVKDGMVTEATHSSVLGVVDGIVRTAPLSNRILAGITRGVILDLCDDLGIPVAAFPMTDAEMRDADELFITGTSCEVTPIVQVDGRPIADGKPGAVTRRLQQAFRSRTRTVGPARG